MTANTSLTMDRPDDLAAAPSSVAYAAASGASDDGEPVRHVTIVGGGTAGWLTAMILFTRLNRGRRGPPIKVTLIEFPNVPIIGVGEGTLPGFVTTLRDLGIGEAELIRRCNLSYKLGVRFVGWNQTDAGVPYSFTHAFRGPPQTLAGINPYYHYLAFGPHPGCDPHDLSDSTGPTLEAIRLNRAPRNLSEGPGKGLFDRYAYHFDAARLAEFMREKAIARGVQHVLDDVDDVAVGEGEMITHLKLRAGGLVPVEFVIDCSGFKALLMSKTLKEPFQSYSKHLLCDRALALQIPYPQGSPIESCTTSTALGAGWVWRVPLYTRIGTGYVFSSAFRTDEEATLEYCRHLGVDPDKVEVRVIPMRVGRSRRAWVGQLYCHRSLRRLHRAAGSHGYHVDPGRGRRHHRTFPQQVDGAGLAAAL